MMQGDRKYGAGGTAEFTGRTLVLLSEQESERALTDLENRAGIRAVRSRDLVGEVTSSGSILFEELGVAVVEGDPDQTNQLSASTKTRDGAILASEPERIVYALGLQYPELVPTNGHARSLPSAGMPSLVAPQDVPPELGGVEDVQEFLRGYREAICHLESVLMRGRDASKGPDAMLEEAALAADATWGLSVTKAARSRYSGKGVSIAVLDTGFDRSHPDFAGRTVVSASFVAGEPPHDGHGHGTHCIGTACGPRRSSGGAPGYGVAYEADIYAGKVLSDSGSGSDAGILAGIDWAVKNKVAIVSMSLGARVPPGAAPSTVFETTARRAAAKGTAIIAAAGNDSERPGYVAPVNHPANCPSILAVGALDDRLRAASFSCGGLTAGGGEVNVAGPGVAVFSSWPMPTRYRTIGGTSMATPHVAGIAALYAEATGLRGYDLLNAMLRRSRRLSPIRDFGWGLVQSV